ncbi:MAG TPA: metallophosphoesterase family protein [Thermoanaerobaculia bacterium]|nr:metallophosphoesterase family protein [Thermoanaerobaculia bacterium]
MRYLILSDMHGNWEAFDQVLRRAAEEPFDRILVLGDLVGYGASPNEVVEAVRALPDPVLVRGNHDKVICGIDPGENFNQIALQAARWTTHRLTAENLDYVRELPPGPKEIAPGTYICHGSPLDEDAYVFSDYDAFEIFSAHPAELIFFGHTHVPSLFALSRRGIEVRVLRGNGSLVLEEGTRYLVNPGSIGQPRDRDPRAAFMIWDAGTRTIHWFRIDYEIPGAQRRIVEAGLPGVLSDRLAVGI